MSSPVSSSNDLIVKEITSQYPDIDFIPSDKFKWNARSKTIHYKAKSLEDIWSLLHEIGHMRLEHTDFRYDLDLVKMEVAAWQQAKQIAKEHGIQIDSDHIEGCLDSYRDWLHRRSQCGQCNQTGWQQKELRYECLNCGFTWQVSSDQLCRVYRKTLS